MRGILFFLSVLGLSGCGDEVAYVANAVDLQVHFSEKLVSVHFDLNPQYHIQKKSRVTFEDQDIVLSRITTDYNSSVPRSTLGAIFSAKAMRDHEWPTEELKEFPNLHRLPKSVPSGSLESLEIERDGLIVKSLYQQEPYLIIGGALLSFDFTQLPPGFLATQYFKDEYGSIVASISIAGPTLTTKGGIYFLGNFGLNPFAIKELRNKMHLHAKGERANIVTQGSGIISFFSIFDLIRNLEARLQIFEP